MIMQMEDIKLPFSRGRMEDIGDEQVSHFVIGGGAFQ